MRYLPQTCTAESARPNCAYGHLFSSSAQKASLWFSAPLEPQCEGGDHFKVVTLAKQERHPSWRMRRRQLGCIRIVKEVGRQSCSYALLGIS